MEAIEPTVTSGGGGGGRLVKGPDGCHNTHCVQRGGEGSHAVPVDQYKANHGNGRDKGLIRTMLMMAGMMLK